MQLEGREIPCCTCCSPLQVGLLLHSGNDAEISLSKRKVGGCGWCADTNESYETEPIASITGGYAGTDKTFDSHSVYWGVATILFGFIVFVVDIEFGGGFDYYIPGPLILLIGFILVAKGCCAPQRATVTLYTSGTEPTWRGPRVRTLTLPLCNKSACGSPAAEKFEEAKHFVATVLARARATRAIKTLGGHTGHPGGFGDESGL